MFFTVIALQDRITQVTTFLIVLCKLYCNYSTVLHDWKEFVKASNEVFGFCQGENSLTVPYEWWKNSGNVVYN